jgi:hypothetical protein
MKNQIKISILGVAISLLVGCATNTGINSLDHGNLYKPMEVNTPAPWSYAVIDDVTGTAPAAKIERFELRDGDCMALGSDWNDCEHDRNRTEAHADSNERDYLGDEVWYGWSIYLPVDFKDACPTSTVLGQVHGFNGNNGGDMLLFQYDCMGYTINRIINNNSLENFPILNEGEMVGKWNRIELHVRWSRENDGFVEVYANGEKKYTYSGKTFGDCDTAIMKYGIYHSYISRYHNTYNKPIPTQVVYYANTKHSKTREGLLPKVNLKAN